MTKVQILLSTYNGEKWIDEQLESLLAQTHTQWELIVRDDGSKDSTLEKLRAWQKRYPEKLVSIYGGENVGVIQSFNRLLKIGNAPFYAFCDQDDVWKKDKLEKLLQVIENKDQTKPLLVHSDLNVVDQSLKTIHPSFWEYTHLKKAVFHPIPSRTLIQNTVTGCACLFNQKAATMAYPIAQTAIMHDWWIALCAATFGKIYTLDEPLIHYRQHGNNTLGAQKHTSLFNLKNYKQRRKKHGIMVKKIEAQANSFLDQHQEKLDHKNKKMMDAFLLLNRTPLRKRIFLIFRYQFYKSGLLRNLVYMFLK